MLVFQWKTTLYNIIVISDTVENARIKALALLEDEMKLGYRTSITETINLSPDEITHIDDFVYLNYNWR